MVRRSFSVMAPCFLAAVVGPLAYSGDGSPGGSASSGTSSGSGTVASSGGSSGTPAGGSGAAASGSGSSSGAGGSGSSASGSTGSSGQGGGSGAGAGNDGGASSGGAADASTGASSGGSGSLDGGSGGTGGPDASIEAGPNAPSTATRPQLTDVQASTDTILNYLAQGTSKAGTLVTDNWNPTSGLGDPAAWTPTFTVAADGTGTHTTVQAAISAATGSSRAYILVKPGTYREPVCVSASAPPITVYGASSDASLVTIVFNNQASAITKPNPCAPTGTGTFATATLMAFADGFQAKNLTISNDFASPNGTFQAVALMTQADKQVYENIRLHGFQDTFFVHTASVTTVSRVYVKNSFIEGDTDFIFGRATAVLDACTINYLSSRRSGGAGGAMLAPSTVTSNNYGFLVIGSSLTAQSGTASGVAYLGRAWDNSGTPANGQAVIRESLLGAHIMLVAPWAAAATSGRPFSATGNRLFEYRNTGPGAAH